MSSVSLFPPLSLLFRNPPNTNLHSRPTFFFDSKSVLQSRNPQFAPPPPLRRSVAAVNARSSKSSDGSSFMDEDGAIDDMDGYMNQLSLEYDSVWDTKPSWCQPWTITLTGVLAITLSWLILHSVAVTTVVVGLISAWWYIFLYNYPKAYADMIAERRKKVTEGVEDTFGFKGQ